MRLRRTGLPWRWLVAALSLFSCTVASLSSLRASLRVGQVVDLSSTRTSGVPRSVHLACGPDQGRRPQPWPDQPDSPVQGHRVRRCCDHVHKRSSSMLYGATLPTEGRQGGGRRDGLDWRPAKGPRRPPGPGPPRTLPARSSPWLSSAPAQGDVEGPATDSTPGLDPRARPRGDLDTFRRCGHLDHLSDHRDASLTRMSQHDCQLVSPTAGALGGTRNPNL